MRRRHHARVGGEHARDVGVDLAEVGPEGSGERHGGGVRAAPAECRYVALARDALEAGDDRDDAFRERLTKAVAPHLEDACAGVGGVGDDAGLAAGEGGGGDAELGEGHAQQGHRYPLAGGEQHVELAPGADPAHVLGEAYEPVGRLAHGAHDDDDLGAASAACGPRGRRRHGCGRRRRPMSRRTSARRGSRSQATARPGDRSDPVRRSAVKTGAGCKSACRFSSVALRAHREEGAAACRARAKASRHPKKPQAASQHAPWASSSVVIAGGDHRHRLRRERRYEDGDDHYDHDFDDVHLHDDDNDLSAADDATAQHGRGDADVPACNGIDKARRALCRRLRRSASRRPRCGRRRSRPTSATSSRRCPPPPRSRRSTTSSSWPVQLLRRHGLLPCDQGLRRPGGAVTDADSNGATGKGYLKYGYPGYQFTGKRPPSSCSTKPQRTRLLPGRATWQWRTRGTFFRRERILLHPARWPDRAVARSTRSLATSSRV